MKTFFIYLLVGVILALLGILDIKMGTRKKKRCTASAEARIVEVQSEEDSAGSENTHKKYSYTPIYEFTVNGAVIRKSGGIYSHNKKAFRVGDTARVMYDPADPETFLVNGKSGVKSFGIGLLLFGILIIVISFTQL